MADRTILSAKRSRIISFIEDATKDLGNIAIKSNLIPMAFRLNKKSYS